MPFLLPIILIGTTVASVIASATIPQSINEPTKKEIIVQTKKEVLNQIPNETKSQFTKFVFTEFIKQHGLILLVLAFVVGVLLLR